MAVTLYGVSVPVESIEERWEDEEDWWKDNPLVRVTYHVTLGGRPAADHLQEHADWGMVSALKPESELPV